MSRIFIILSPSWGPSRVNMVANGDDSSVWRLILTCENGPGCCFSAPSCAPLLDGASPFSCHASGDWSAILYIYFLTLESLGSPGTFANRSKVKRKTRMLQLYNLPNVSPWEKFQMWFATDLQPCRISYETPEWITTNMQVTYNRGGSNCELGHSQAKSKSSTTLFWGSKTIVERVDFSAGYLRVIASIKE